MKILKKIISKLVYLAFVIYLVYLLYFKGTTKTGFIIGNIVLVLVIIFELLKIYMITTAKGDKDYQLINEVLNEFEEEKKNKK